MTLLQHLGRAVLQRNATGMQTGEANNDKVVVSHQTEAEVVMTMLHLLSNYWRRQVLTEMVPRFCVVWCVAPRRTPASPKSVQGDTHMSKVAK